MPDSFNPLLPVLDAVSRYLPASLADPLYTLASADLASLRDHPSQLLPLGLAVLAAYTAFLSTLSSLRFAFRTSVFVAKWGSLAALGSAIYMAYQGAGTERGALGGAQDAAQWAQMGARGAYSLGRRGLNYYFGSSSSSRSANRRTGGRASSSPRTGRGKTAAPVGGTATDGAGETAEFVQTALDSVLEFLQPGAGSAQEKLKRTAKRAAGMGQQQDSDRGGRAGLGGWAWDLAMGRAQQAWQEVVGGGGAAETNGNRRNRAKSTRGW